MKAARHWQKVNAWLNYAKIFLAALTTIFAMFKSIPNYQLVVAMCAGLTTLFTTTFAFLKPADRRQGLSESSKVFRGLMLRMARCRSLKKYEKLWEELNQAMLDEPIVQKKYTSRLASEWIMMPELSEVIVAREQKVSTKQTLPPVTFIAEGEKDKDKEVKDTGTEKEKKDNEKKGESGSDKSDETEAIDDNKLMPHGNDKTDEKQALLDTKDEFNSELPNLRRVSSMVMNIRNFKPE